MVDKVTQEYLDEIKEEVIDDIVRAMTYTLNDSEENPEDYTPNYNMVLNDLLEKIQKL